MRAGDEIRIDAATDTAALGLWDVSCDGEPLDKTSAPNALEADVVAGKVFRIHTDGDDRFPTAIFVDQEIPADIVDYTLPAGGWRLLHAPSGRLCFGGLEDYRRSKKRITSTKDEFDVPAGDYRVCCRAIDVRIPELALAEGLGTEDFRYWRQLSTRDAIACFSIVICGVASVVLGALYSWWICAGGFGFVLAAPLFLDWMRNRDPRLREINARIAQLNGGRTFEEVEEEFFEGKVPCVIQMLRLASNDAKPEGGSVALRDVWDLEVNPKEIE